MAPVETSSFTVWPLFGKVTPPPNYEAALQMVAKQGWPFQQHSLSLAEDQLTAATFEKVNAVTTFLGEMDIVEFGRLLPSADRRHVRDIIVSFLAILELAKLKFIEIIQTESEVEAIVREARS